MEFVGWLVLHVDHWYKTTLESNVLFCLPINFVLVEKSHLYLLMQNNEAKTEQTTNKGDESGLEHQLGISQRMTQ